MSDEDLYLIATNEVEDKDRNAALWAKVIALAEGNKDKAKYQYIKLRVEQLKEKATLSSVDSDYDILKRNVGYYEVDFIGFIWWQIWAWLNLIVGNLFIIIQLDTPYNLPLELDNLALEVGIPLIILNSILTVMILKFNKYAFLVLTVLSLNPLLWIINGIYLKKRWNHPQVNSDRGL